MYGQMQQRDVFFIAVGQKKNKRSESPQIK